MSYKIYVRSKNRDMEVHYTLVVCNEMHTFSDIARSFKTKKFLSHCHFQLPVDHPQWLNANQSCVWKLKMGNSPLVKNRWVNKTHYDVCGKGQQQEFFIPRRDKRPPRKNPKATVFLNMFRRLILRVGKSRWSSRPLERSKSRATTC